jgi:hypothetical protein
MPRIRTEEVGGGPSPRPREARPQERGSVKRPGIAANVLAVQRAAGNAAVARALAPVHRGRALARYGTGEHWRTGGSRTASIGGERLTEGELITMGDLYEAPEDLLQADPAELHRLLALVRRAAAHQSIPRLFSDVSDGEWEAATAARKRRKKPQKTYLELAADNAAHFGRGSGWAAAFRPSNWSEFRRYHRRAIERTRAAGNVPDDALVLNGFACHFLTDAFAAGHLFNKSEMLRRIEAAWERQRTTGWPLRQTAFTRGVAHKVLSHRVAGPKLQRYWLRLLEYGPITETRFSEFLWQMSTREPGQFREILLKLVHDRLNHAIERDPGLEVEVTNARGTTWLLAGDGTLRLSQDTISIMREAVEESFRNLELAASAPGVIDEEKMAEAVWAYTPRPTKHGAHHMETLVLQSLDYADDRTMTAFANVAIGNIDIVIAQLKARNVLLESEEAIKLMEMQNEYLRDHMFRTPPALPF